MNQFVENALTHLKENWHTGIVGTAAAAQLLNINPSTFKTRLSRGQALVMRESSGEQRAVLTFTGFHLVYNLLSDRLLRYGFPVEHDGTTMAENPYRYAEWAFENVLSPPYFTNAVLRMRKEPDGTSQNMMYENGDMERWTGDAALLIPLGTMVTRLAVSLYSRSGKDAVINDMMAHVAPMSEGLDD